ncbi:ABC transporter ATP-binding protein/permease [Acidithiobacillus thiooxidans]|uniref:Putative ABC transporter ATP-binding protein n=1 Tax=Acidithiobacillus thiooxidans ATCC 19377 TaxID=637390 RepID=A0A543PZY6_ACITH|nr:ABC transporter ATP-binding protein/permease [Acidithiobacillus thiooxidans]MDX5936353.1 ABC transporter ATP-binding protein/permease [Acidithiobacillus thiooxidans]TQN49644.1 putative ABC transporter ATP-binding protein [Acidithiobacillus thiooxidans ATCC 19377]
MSLFSLSYDVLNLVAPYLKDKNEKKLAITLFLIITIANVLLVYISYRITEWYALFFNALQHFKMDAAWYQILIFTCLVSFFIIVYMGQLFLTYWLTIRWRKWMTKDYLHKWTSNKVGYIIQNYESNGVDNPDQRIADDINHFTEQTMSIYVGMLGSVVTLMMFSYLLWTLSKQITLPLDGKIITIPGYLFWAALIYSAAGTIVAHKIGKKLSHLNFTQEKYQADFRVGMVNLRSNNATFALQNSEDTERSYILSSFNNVYQNRWKIIWRSTGLALWQSSFGQAGIIFPYLVTLPAYFINKSIGIGGLQEIVVAFTAVQSAMSYLVNNYGIIANWHAILTRLVTFSKALIVCHDLRKSLPLKTYHNEGLEINNLDVRLPNGKKIINCLSMNLNPSEHLIIKGASGVGKSILIQTLAGLSLIASGSVGLPTRNNGNVIFLPQQPYINQGTLMDVVLYPQNYKNSDNSDQEISDALARSGLSHYIADLNKNENWNKVLSNSEKQRIIFSRILLLNPRIVFFDEATSYIDDNDSFTLYNMIIEKFPNISIIISTKSDKFDTFANKILKLKFPGIWELTSV